MRDMETFEQGTREGRTVRLFTEVGWIPVNSVYPSSQHIGESLSSVGFRERTSAPWNPGKSSNPGDVVPVPA